MAGGVQGPLLPQNIGGFQPNLQVYGSAGSFNNFNVQQVLADVNYLLSAIQNPQPYQTRNLYSYPCQPWPPMNYIQAPRQYQLPPVFQKPIVPYPPTNYFYPAYPPPVQKPIYSRNVFPLPQPNPQYSLKSHQAKESPPPLQKTEPVKKPEIGFKKSMYPDLSEFMAPKAGKAEVSRSTGSQESNKTKTSSPEIVLKRAETTRTEQSSIPPKNTEVENRTSRPKLQTNPPPIAPKPNIQVTPKKVISQTSKPWGPDNPPPLPPIKNQLQTTQGLKSQPVHKQKESVLPKEAKEKSESPGIPDPPPLPPIGWQKPVSKKESKVTENPPVQLKAKTQTQTQAPPSNGPLPFSNTDLQAMRDRLKQVSEEEKARPPQPSKSSLPFSVEDLQDAKKHLKPVLATEDMEKLEAPKNPLFELLERAMEERRNIMEVKKDEWLSDQDDDIDDDDDWDD